jgi:hypothetical protein
VAYDATLIARVFARAAAGVSHAREIWDRASFSNEAAVQNLAAQFGAGVLFGRASGLIGVEIGGSTARFGPFDSLGSWDIRSVEIEVRIVAATRF